MAKQKRNKKVIIGTRRVDLRGIFDRWWDLNRKGDVA